VKTISNAKYEQQCARWATKRAAHEAACKRHVVTPETRLAKSQRKVRKYLGL